jgi:hypothetical protein
LELANCRKEKRKTVVEKHRKAWFIIMICLLGLSLAGGAYASAPETAHGEAVEFPPSLESYHDSNMKSIGAILANRISKEPFNLVATLIFLCAIIHTFLTSKFLAYAHKWEHEHEEKIQQGLAHKHSVHIPAGIFHFLGEVEVVFGIWVIALGAAIFLFHDWHTFVGYISHNVNFTEAMFVVVIMILASTRPILKVAEKLMWRIANVMGGTLAAWWFTILTIGPLLGSLITEPAAMTISALLLAHKLYDLDPSVKFKYATIGLLFVNVSVGGTLTHFAAPPVLMVAAPWNWGTDFMIAHFGWKAFVGILISNGVYFFIFREELEKLQEKFALKDLKDKIQRTYLGHRDLETEVDKAIAAVDVNSTFVNSLKGQLDEKTEEVKAQLGKQLLERHEETLREKGLDMSLVSEAFEQRFEEIKLLRMRKGFPRLLPEDKRPEFRDPQWDTRDDPVPAWIIVIHACFMAWTIINAHHPQFFIPGLLFFLGFAHVTSPYQNIIDLKPSLLVGFFLAGLVIHGGVQAWWIAPVLGSLKEMPLMLAATVLTAFNDNAAITYLSTLVPGFTDSLKYAVVAGAVTGGGLTVIANAPNPAGQSLLKKYFDNGVSPPGLLKAALLPTIIVWLCFFIFK